jgi:energy-coupling factor transport system substrate-specific component
MLAGGFVMGPSFGFAMGALTLLVSAALTAGFGPWLPYQMLAAGWVGMGAGLLGGLTHGRSSRLRLGSLAGYAVIAGFGYGLLLDLWEWPLLLGAGTSPISWAAGLAPSDLARRFGAFYLATSLVYDSFRAGGNLLLVLVAGAPVVAALQRFRLRFLVDWVPAGNMSPYVGASPRYRAPTRAD